MTRSAYVIVVLVLLSVGFSSCRKKVCPAYYSALILDEELQHRTFLTFGPDSALDYRGRTDKRNIHGITKPIKSERKKRKKLKMIELKTIFPEPKDAIPEGQPTLVLQNGDSVVSDTRSQFDSLGRRIGQPPYNVDQESYNHILGPILKKWSPPPPPKPPMQLEEQNLTRKERRQRRREARKNAKDGFIQLDENGNPVTPNADEDDMKTEEPTRKSKKQKTKEEKKEEETPEPAAPAGLPPPSDTDGGF